MNQSLKSRFLLKMTSVDLVQWRRPISSGLGSDLKELLHTHFHNAHTQNHLHFYTHKTHSLSYVQICNFAIRISIPHGYKSHMLIHTWLYIRLKTFGYTNAFNTFIRLWPFKVSSFKSTAHVAHSLTSTSKEILARNSRPPSWRVDPRAAGGRPY